MIRYLITGGDSASDERRWLRHLAEWMARGVDFIQIREREVTARRLAYLTRAILAERGSNRTRILVNDRADVALACGADGVHLRGGAIDPALFARAAFARKEWTISAACHAVPELDSLGAAELILLSPIFAPFSKTTSNRPLGIEAIRAAAGRTLIPIIALGGITAANERECLEAGAAGIAGISYFGNPPPE